MFQKGKMQYRNLGNSGLQVSALSFGTFTNTDCSYEENLEIVKKCFQNGINFIDTSESYVNGKGEETLGKILKEIGQPRQKYVISTKIWNSPDPSINTKGNTNRFHVRTSIINCLKRLQLDYVDVAFAHSYDENTSIEETCRAFHQIIEQGHCFYWGTSNWNADEVFEAFEVCEELNLHKPIAAQNPYNMVDRQVIECRYEKLFKVYHYGLVAYQPLMGGVLTGKFLNPENKTEGSRLHEKTEKTGGYDSSFLRNLYFNGLNQQQLSKSLIQIKKIAQEQLHCTLTHLAIAWSIKFEHTSTALFGARNVVQLQEILQSLDVVDKLTPEIEGKINKIMKRNPNPRTNFKYWKSYPPIRPAE